MATGHFALHVHPRPMLFLEKLQRRVLSSLQTKYHKAASANHLPRDTRRKLCKLAPSFKTTPHSCLPRKERTCMTWVTHHPISIHRRFLSMFLPFQEDGKLKHACSTAQTVLFASPFSSTSASSHDTKPEVITLIETKDDLETFLAQVSSVLNLRESPKSYATSMQNLRSIVEKLVSLECDSRSILAMLVANPDILSVRTDRLLCNIDYLHMLGLNWRRLLKTLDGNTPLWKTPLQQLQGRVKQLRKLGFVEGQMQKVIADWPQIMTIASAQLNAVAKVLMENCSFPRAELLTILTDSPAILAEDLENIELRFQYAYFRMGIQNNSEMTQAKIFKYSLDHLRCRHLILERLGLYAAPNNRGHFAMKNPRLSRIIDSSDGRFTEKVAKISIEDYETFAKMLLEEIKVEKVNKDGGPSVGDDNEFTDEDSHYDDDDDIDSDSNHDLSHDVVSMTESFDFDKVDYRKKR